MRAQHEVIPMQIAKECPTVDIVFTGCRSNADWYAFDIIDFPNRKIDRWKLPFARNEKWPVEIRSKMYPIHMPYGRQDVLAYCDDHYMTPHTAQLSPQGKLFVTFGVSENGFGMFVIDTLNGEYQFVDGGQDAPKLFVSTGDFDLAYRDFLFARWPMTNTARDAAKVVPNSLEIRALDINTFKERVLYTLTESVSDGKVSGAGLPRSLHQVSMSDDGRYVVCAPYDGIKEAPTSSAPVGDERSVHKFAGTHRAILEDVITIDLQTSRHWFTKIPVPVPAHIEYDPIDPHVFYASAHNIAGTTIGTMLEGNAKLFRLQIRDGKTDIVGGYTDPELYRITQHSLFRYNGRVLVVMTCVPNRLVILDAESMTLWRDIKLFDAPPIKLTDAGALSPDYVFSVYSVNPCADGKYIVLENGRDFIFYGLDEDRVLDMRVSRSIPADFRGRGHTRTAGQ
jgi:hypothetical protein